MCKKEREVIHNVQAHCIQQGHGRGNLHYEEQPSQEIGTEGKPLGNPLWLPYGSLGLLPQRRGQVLTLSPLPWGDPREGGPGPRPFTKS